MSKKSNTLLFLLGATVFNVLVTIVCFLLLLLLYVQFLNITGIDPESAGSIGIPLTFVGAIVLAFVIYRVVFKQISKKYNLEQYLAPIFGPSRPPRKKTD